MIFMEKLFCIQIPNSKLSIFEQYHPKIKAKTKSFFSFVFHSVIRQKSDVLILTNLILLPVFPMITDMNIGLKERLDSMAMKVMYLSPYQPVGLLRIFSTAVVLLVKRNFQRLSPFPV